MRDLFIMFHFLFVSRCGSRTDVLVKDVKESVKELKPRAYHLAAHHLRPAHDHQVLLPRPPLWIFIRHLPCLLHLSHVLVKDLQVFLHLQLQPTRGHLKSTGYQPCRPHHLQASVPSPAVPHQVSTRSTLLCMLVHLSRIMSPLRFHPTARYQHQVTPILPFHTPTLVPLQRTTTTHQHWLVWHHATSDLQYSTSLQLPVRSLLAELQRVRLLLLKTWRLLYEYFKRDFQLNLFMLHILAGWFTQFKLWKISLLKRAHDHAYIEGRVSNTFTLLDCCLKNYTTLCKNYFLSDLLLYIDSIRCNNSLYST